MKRKKILGALFAVVFAVCLGFALVACKKDNSESNGGGNNNESVASAFTAQLGYDWEIPTPNNIKDYVVSVKSGDGAELQVKENKVFFDTLGKYTISYTSGDNVKTAEVVVVDTERPKFDKFWEGEWRDNVEVGEYMTIKAKAETTVCLNDYFRCSDNSGKVDVSYQVLRGGVDEIELDDENKFNVEDVDYYWIYATAKDQSNNYTQIKYKLTVLAPDVICDYSYTHANGDTRNDVLTIPAADFDLKEGDKVTVTLKLKSNISNVYAMPVYVTDLGDRTTGSEYKLSTYTDWTEVTFKMTVTTGATAKSKVIQSWDTLADSTVDESAVGLFFFILNSSSCYNQSLWAKDVTVTKIADAPVECDYSYTHADGDTRNDVLTIPAADFDLKEGDKVTVTLKLKSNISNEYAMPVYVTDLGDRTTGSDYKLSTYTDWTEVTFKMTVTTGATAKSKVIQSWDTLADSTVDESAVGLFFFILNSSTCYNQSLWAKDVTITKIADAPVECDYSYTHAADDTRNDVLTIPAADFNLKEGDKVTVTLKLKSNISNEYAMPVYVTDLGDRTTGSDYKLSTYTDWTEVTFKMTVTTGATAKSKVIQSWDTLADSTVDESAVGLFFFILNSSTCYNQSLWAKDVTITKIAEEKPADYDYVYTQAATETKWGMLELPATGYNVGDKVKVTFKVKTDFAYEYSTLVWIDADGNVKNWGMPSVFDNYREWTEVTFEMTVTTGATAKNTIAAKWTDMPGGTADDDAEGLFFVVMNATGNKGQSIWAKDLVIEKIATATAE